jgi:hypothetical protein
MTTPLKKSIGRLVSLPRGPVHVTLHADGLVSFREKGRRKSFTLPLSSVFLRAVDAEVAREKAERIAARKARRAAR